PPPCSPRLPHVPGRARSEHVSRAPIDPALPSPAPRSRRPYVYPPRHYASSSTDPDLPAMGVRLRIKKDFDVSSFPKQARIVLRALQRYGMILADNGSPWYISGSPSRGWNDDDLHQLGRVHGRDFEVVRGP